MRDTSKLIDEENRTEFQLHFFLLPRLPRNIQCTGKYFKPTEVDSSLGVARHNKEA